MIGRNGLAPTETESGTRPAQSIIFRLPGQRCDGASRSGAAMRGRPSQMAGFSSPIAKSNRASSDPLILSIERTQPLAWNGCSASTKPTGRFSGLMNIPATTSTLIPPGRERLLLSRASASGPWGPKGIRGKRVWTLGAEGDLVCLDVESGKPISQKQLTGPDAPTPMWGFAGHPLIDGEKLICLTAGKNAVVTAFNKNTGDVIWSAISAKHPGYSPPMLFEPGGRRRLL